MGKKSYYFALFILSFAVTFCGLTAALAQVPENAPAHIQTTENFIANVFETQGQFDEAKIAAFGERLQREKVSLMNNAYETKLIEKIELDIEDHQSGLKSAKKELDAKKSDHAQAYDLFLIPKVKELRVCASTRKPAKICRELAYQFVRGYMAFYLPDSPRSYNHQDIDYLYVIKNFFGYSYKRNSVTAEASNLMVEKENRAVTQACLKQNVPDNHVLTPIQIEKLKSCGADLSVYNPMDDSMWKRPTPSLMAEAKNAHEEWYPTPEEIVYFKAIKFSGAGSPKFEAEFTRGGDDIDVKIKMGVETHSDTAASILGKLVGLYQDSSITRPTLKVYFKEKDTFESFRVQWARKYAGRNKELNTFVKSYGKDHTGSYVELKDVQLSINDKKYLRLNAYDPAAWDLQNLREHRALILWLAFLNINDSKTGNHAMLYEKTDRGLVPRFSFQDVGYSLRYIYQANLKSILFNLKNVYSWGVNTFAATFLNWDENQVHIQWGDIILNRPKFRTTTYNDVRWMARQIAKLKKEDIEYAVLQAGYPRDVADLYVIKLVHRRNEMIRAFRLEDEFDAYATPDLATFSPNRKVKNGQVVASHFDGYTSYELPRMQIIPMILKSVIAQADLIKMHGQFTTKLAQNSLLSADVAVGSPTDFKVLDIIPGVHFHLSRTVNDNHQYSIVGKESQGFYVKDKFSVEVGAGSEIFGALSKLFPAELILKGKVQAWKREYEFVHFANSWREGYAKPFRVLRFIPNFKDQVVDEIKRNEVLKVADSFGFEIRAKAPVAVVTGIPLVIGAQFSWYNSRPTYFARDVFNQFTVYHAENSTLSYGFAVGLDQALDFAFIHLPLLEFSHTHTEMKHKSSFYRFGQLGENQPNVSIEQNANTRLDGEILERYFEYGDSDPLVLAKKEIGIEAKTVRDTNLLKFLFFLKNKNESGQSEVKVRTSQRTTRRFGRYFIGHEKIKGIDERVIFDSALINLRKDSVSIAVEADRDKPDSTTAFIEFWDYHRTLKHANLVSQINEINTRFSLNPATPFYREFALPTAQEVRKFKKVYFYTRLYVNGNDVIRRVKNLDESLFESLFREVNGAHVSEDDDEFQWGALKNAFLNLKAVSVTDKDYLKRYAEFLKALRIEEYGVALLQKLAGNDKLFLMGEIYGIYPSFSALQQSTQSAGQRFAARSWGNYVIPPLRSFLHDFAIKHESLFIEGDVRFEEIFGPLPTSRVNYF